MNRYNSNVVFFSEIKNRLKIHTAKHTTRCDEMSAAVSFPFNNIRVCFCNKIYQHFEDIVMVTSCTPLIDDLFLYFYKIQCMTKLSTESSKFNSIEKKMNNSPNILP